MRLGPEEKKFGSHHVLMRNDKVWSDSVINDVFVNVETWYASTVFGSNLIKFCFIKVENDIMNPEWWLVEGLPKKNL